MHLGGFALAPYNALCSQFEECVTSFDRKSLAQHFIVRKDHRLYVNIPPCSESWWCSNIFVICRQPIVFFKIVLYAIHKGNSSCLIRTAVLHYHWTNVSAVGTALTILQDSLQMEGEEWIFSSRPLINYRSLSYLVHLQYRSHSSIKPIHVNTLLSQWTGREKELKANLL